MPIITLKTPGRVESQCNKQLQIKSNHHLKDKAKLASLLYSAKRSLLQHSQSIACRIIPFC